MEKEGEAEEAMVPRRHGEVESESRGDDDDDDRRNLLLLLSLLLKLSLLRLAEDTRAEEIGALGRWRQKEEAALAAGAARLRRRRSIGTRRVKKGD